MKRFAVALSVVALVTPMVLGLHPSTASATAPPATIQIENQAQLQPDGSVLLTVDWSCDPNFDGPTGTLLTAVDQPGATGNAAAVVACDDQKHKTTLDNVPGPFHPGLATAFADLRSTNGGGNAFTQAEMTVK